jgi:hypothetical protein
LPFSFGSRRFRLQSGFWLLWSLGLIRDGDIPQCRLGLKDARSRVVRDLEFLLTNPFGRDSGTATGCFQGRVRIGVRAEDVAPGKWFRVGGEERDLRTRSSQSAALTLKNDGFPRFGGGEFFLRHLVLAGITRCA